MNQATGMHKHRGPAAITSLCAERKDGRRLSFYAVSEPFFHENRSPVFVIPNVLRRPSATVSNGSISPRAQQQLNHLGVFHS